MGEHNCSSMRKMYRYVNLELQITLCANKNFYPDTILGRFYNWNINVSPFSVWGIVRSNRYYG